MCVMPRTLLMNAKYWSSEVIYSAPWCMKGVSQFVQVFPYTEKSVSVNVNVQFVGFDPEDGAKRRWLMNG